MVVKSKKTVFAILVVAAFALIMTVFAKPDLNAKADGDYDVEVTATFSTVKYNVSDNGEYTLLAAAMNVSDITRVYEVGFKAYNGETPVELAPYAETYKTHYYTSVNDADAAAIFGNEYNGQKLIVWKIESPTASLSYEPYIKYGYHKNDALWSYETEHTANGTKKAVTCYTVTIDADGGLGAPSSVVVPYGTSAAALNGFTVTKADSLFYKWQLKTGVDTYVDIPNNATVTEDIEVKAVWESILSISAASENIYYSVAGKSSTTTLVSNVAGTTYTSGSDAIATVAGDTVTAAGNGNVTITAQTPAGQTDTVTIHVFTGIADNTEFAAIYTDAASLAGNYIITANITEQTVGTNLSPAFSGVLDGDGHTVNVWAKLFGTLSGTVENLTIHGSLGVFGPAVADDLANGGHVENVVVETTITDTRCHDNKNNYYARQAGAMCNFNNGGTIADSVVIMTLPSNMTVTSGYSVANVKAFYSAGSAAESSVTDSVAYYTNNKTGDQLKSHGNVAAISLKPMVTSGDVFEIIAGAVSCVSTEPSVAAVNGTSGFTALGVGTAAVTATYANYSVTYNVTVIARETDEELYKDDTYAFPAGVASCVSSDDSVIEVNGTTGVTALSAGNATVTVIFNDGTTTNYNFTVILDVVESPLALSAGADRIYYDVAGKSATTTITSNVEGTTYTSSSDAIATVSGAGVVTAAGNGNVTITALTPGGQSDTVTIHVFTGFSQLSELNAITCNSTAEIRSGNYIMTADIDCKNGAIFANWGSANYGDSTAAGQANFFGILDGDGHSFNNVAYKLFHWFQGTMENLTINTSATGNAEWNAPVINYFTGTAKNVTVNATMHSTNTNIGLNAYNANNQAGGFAIQVFYGAYFEDCTVNVIIPSTITVKAGYSIADISAYGAKGNGDAPTFVNCTATLVNNYNDDSIYFCKGYSNDLVADTAV